MLHHDAKIAGAERSDCLDVLELAHDQHLATNDARHPRPADDADRREDDAFRRLERRNHRDQQQERGKRQRHVGETHHDLIDPAPVKSGEQAHANAEREGDSLRDEADGERHASPVDETGPDVAALDVGAQPVLAGGALQDMKEVNGYRALTRDQRSDNGGDCHHQNDPYAQTSAIVAEESLSLFGIEHL